MWKKGKKGAKELTSLLVGSKNHGHVPHLRLGDGVLEGLVYEGGNRGFAFV